MRVEEYFQPPLSAALNIIIAELAAPESVPWAVIASRVSDQRLSGSSGYTERKCFAEAVAFIDVICRKFKINTAAVNLYCARETGIGQHENSQLSLQISRNLLIEDASALEFAIGHEFGHYIQGDLIDKQMWEALQLVSKGVVASKSKFELKKLREAARLLQKSELAADAFAVEQFKDKSKAILGARLMLPDTPKASRRYMEHPSTALRLRLIKKMI